MTEENLLALIRDRSSSRKFKDQAVETSILTKILETATFAPSACNRQDWRFIIVESQEIKNKLYDLGGSITIKTAPTVIIVLYSNKTTNTEYNDHIQSASAAIQNILLAAHVHGLSACWICHLPAKKSLRQLLKIPRDFDPIAAVLVGYPENQPKKAERKNKIKDIIAVNSFDFPYAKKTTIDSFLFIRKILLFFYNKLPLFIKRRFLNNFIDDNFVKKFPRDNDS